MNRKQRRAAGERGKVAVYHFTEEQLNAHIQEYLKKERDAIEKDAVSKALTLTLVLPMEVLMDHYWKKSYQKRFPEFVSLILAYYERWENGEITMEELQKDLWEFGGVRFENV